MTPAGRSARELPAIRDDLGALDGYHSAQVDVDVRLNTNESPLPPPAAWQEALAEAVSKLDFHRYPDREAIELRRALADSHGVTPEEIFCANGSNEVLQCLLLAYGGADRAVALFEPTYTLHAHIARVTGTKVAAGPRRDDFALDLEVVTRVLADAEPVVTFLCSPNNPTGRADSAEELAAVADLAPGLLVVDEAYGQFAPSSALELRQRVPDGTRHVVVVRTFSKTWSMAAARLGYLIGPAPVVEALERVALPYHLDALKQAAGLLALRFVGEMEDRIGLIVRERQRLLAALARLPVTAWPSQANFILFRPEQRKGAEVWQGLLDRSVLVRDTSTWPRLANCLRVTVGTPEENDAFLSALAEVLA